MIRGTDFENGRSCPRFIFIDEPAPAPEPIIDDGPDGSVNVLANQMPLCAGEVAALKALAAGLDLVFAEAGR